MYVNVKGTFLIKFVVSFARFFETALFRDFFYIMIFQRFDAVLKIKLNNMYYMPRFVEQTEPFSIPNDK